MFMTDSKLSKLKTPHIGINTIKIDKTLAFYDALGFKVVSKDYSESSNRDRYVVENDVFIIEIFHRFDEGYKEAPGGKAVGWYHLGLPVEVIKPFYEKLKALGAQFEREPQMRPSGHAICFAVDPNGIVVELISDRLE